MSRRGATTRRSATRTDKEIRWNKQRKSEQRITRDEYVTRMTDPCPDCGTPIYTWLISRCPACAEARGDQKPRRVPNEFEHFMREVNVDEF